MAREGKFVACVPILSLCLLVACGTPQAPNVSEPNTISADIPPPTASSSNNENAFVADEQAAIEIAIKVWIPIYGKEQINQEKPYLAELKNGIWTVTGSLPKDWVGGVAVARISQKDGKVIEIGHGK